MSGYHKEWCAWWDYRECTCYRMAGRERHVANRDRALNAAVAQPPASRQPSASTDIRTAYD